MGRESKKLASKHFIARAGSVGFPAELLTKRQEAGPDEGRKPLVILSIGCGDTLFEVDLLVNSGASFKYLGIDLDEECIRRCRESFSDQEHINFFCTDGNDIHGIQEELQKLGVRQADIVMLRHPVLYPTNPVRQHFIKIWINTIPALLMPGGVLFASFYYKEEFEIGLKLTRLITENLVVLDANDADPVSFRTEVRSTALGDRTVELFEDRYALVDKCFAPTFGMGPIKPGILRLISPLVVTLSTSEHFKNEKNCVLFLFACVNAHSQSSSKDEFLNEVRSLEQKTLSDSESTQLIESDKFNAWQFHKFGEGQEAHLQPRLEELFARWCALYDISNLPCGRQSLMMKIINVAATIPTQNELKSLRM